MQTDRGGRGHYAIGIGEMVCRAGHYAVELIEALGLELPPISQPIANFVQSTRAGNLVFVSGQLPRKDGKMLNPGEVGACVTVEPAKEAATPRTLLASIRV